MREQLGDPCRVVDVGLAAGHVADMRGVGQHEFELVLEHMPNRLPVHARGFHRHGRTAMLGQPVRQRQQFAGGAAEAAHLAVLRCRDATHTGDDDVLVHVQSGAAGMNDFHDENLLAVARRRRQSSLSKSTRRASERRRSSSHYGVLAGLRVQLLNGLTAPSKRRPHQQRQRQHYNQRPSSATIPTRFMLRGRTRPMANY